MVCQPQTNAMPRCASLFKDFLALKGNCSLGTQFLGNPVFFANQNFLQFFMVLWSSTINFPSKCEIFSVFQGLWVVIHLYKVCWKLAHLVILVILLWFVGGHRWKGSLLAEMRLLLCPENQCRGKTVQFQIPINPIVFITAFESTQDLKTFLSDRQGASCFFRLYCHQ